jgi:hypothetical protein
MKIKKKKKSGGVIKKGTFRIPSVGLPSAPETGEPEEEHYEGEPLGSTYDPSTNEWTDYVWEGGKYVKKGPYKVSIDHMVETGHSPPKERPKGMSERDYMEWKSKHKRKWGE